MDSYWKNYLRTLLLRQNAEFPEEPADSLTLAA